MKEVWWWNLIIRIKLSPFGGYLWTNYIYEAESDGDIIPKKCIKEKMFQLYKWLCQPNDWLLTIQPSTGHGHRPDHNPLYFQIRRIGDLMHSPHLIQNILDNRIPKCHHNALEYHPKKGYWKILFTQLVFFKKIITMTNAFHTNLNKPKFHEQNLFYLPSYLSLIFMKYWLKTLLACFIYGADNNASCSSLL